MKRFLTVVAVILLVMSSCIREYTIVKPPVPAVRDSEVTFTIGASKVTRAIISGITYPETEHFGVFADVSVDDGTSYYEFWNDAKEIQKVENDWRNIDNHYYWLTDATYNFYAYSPYTATFVYPNSSIKHTAGTNSMVFSYRIGATAAASQEDLMVAQAEDKSSGTVDLDFKHALAQIEFQIRKGSEVDSVKFDEIDLKVPHLFGTCTVTDNIPVWTDMTEGSNVYCVGTSLTNCTNDYTVYGTNILVLPQNISGAAITVKYTYWHTTGRGAVLSRTATKTFSSTAELGEKWEYGHKYIYKITADFTNGGNRNEILFRPVVQDWIVE